MVRFRALDQWELENMMNRNRLLPSLIAVIILGSGCGLITGLGDDDRCDSPPNMRIEIGDEVWFRWGGCRADGLRVVNNIFQSDWDIEGEMRSPIQYGVAKNKMTVRAGPEPLLPGGTYRLEMLVNSGGDAQEEFHWMFTR